jgi:hypothetical protein
MNSGHTGGGSIGGFDYTTGRARELSKREWRNTVRGLRRRAEGGETFYHDSQGRIAFEVYAVLPAERRAP